MARPVDIPHFGNNKPFNFTINVDDAFEYLDEFKNSPDYPKSFQYYTPNKYQILGMELEARFDIGMVEARKIVSMWFDRNNNLRTENKMKKNVIRLTESDIERLVTRIIKEDEETYGYKSSDPKQLDLFKTEEGLNTRLDELLGNLKGEFNKRLSAITWNTTNHIGEEIRSWLKDGIKDLYELKDEIYDQISKTVRNEKEYEKYQTLFENMSDELELFFDEAKIKVIEELFKSKDKFFTNKREDKSQLKLDFPPQTKQNRSNDDIGVYDLVDDVLQELNQLYEYINDIQMNNKLSVGDEDYLEELSQNLINYDTFLEDELNYFNKLYNELEEAEDNEDDEEIEYLDQELGELEASIRYTVSEAEDEINEIYNKVKDFVNKNIGE